MVVDGIYQLASEVVLRDADQVCFHTANGYVVRFNEVGYTTLLHFVEPHRVSDAADTISRLFTGASTVTFLRSNFPIGRACHSMKH